MNNENYIKIIQNKSNTPKYAPTLILVMAILFFVGGVVQLFFLNKLIIPFDWLSWSKVLSIALQIEPERQYIGVELQAVVWVMKSLISFLISFFFLFAYFYIKKDLEVCSQIAPLLNEKPKR